MPYSFVTYLDVLRFFYDLTVIISPVDALELAYSKGTVPTGG